MRPLLPREKVIVALLSVLAVVAVFYFYIYTPKLKEINAVSQQLRTQQAELRRLQAEAARKDELERRVQEVGSSVQASEAKLPSAREIPVLLVQLENLSSQVGANLILFKPGPLQGPPQQGAGQPPRPPAPGGRPAVPGGPNFQTFNLEINAEGTFDQIENFVHGIEMFPRFISMTDLRVSPSGKAGENPERPRLSLGLQATTYVVPEGGAGR